VAKGKTDEKEPNMMDMVRAAMGELGMGAKPLALQAHIKEKFGKDMTTQMISNYKFQVRKQGGVKGGRGRGRRAVAAVGGLQIEDFEAVRGLVSRLGADQVKRIVDVVG
jgi:hypothetical protein